RVVVLLAVGSIMLVGVLIATAVLDATSSGPPPNLTSPAAMSVATRSLPPYYTVRPGDTFDSIAALNHLSSAQLQQLNPTQDPTSIEAGQVLRLRVHEPSTRLPKRLIPPFWVVQRGDTYSSIAAKTGAAVADIAQFNPKANPNLLVPGQRLKLRP
ncbi:MAG TPA: LysM peptidoglycan-binding domain-containing protein, partial [Solirubrobacteraceae bacterium]|nr:LysM peptidoglycan-binding domain-containing protein [Solirubrobacteraceae bacterium]